MQQRSLYKEIRHNVYVNLFLPLKYGYYRQIHKHYANTLKRKDKINIVFFAGELAMWRYQGLYELMKDHPRFNVSIVLSPFRRYHDSQKRQSIEKLRKYFGNKGITYIDYDFCDGATPFDVRNELNPDILFYPQYYFNALTPEHDCSQFFDRLVCAFPYFFINVDNPEFFDTPFQNMSWLLFYPTKVHEQLAYKYAKNKGRNVSVTGYPDADSFLNDEIIQVWKTQSKTKKRIIWAPHFSIIPAPDIIGHSSFLQLADIMKEVATKFSDSVQFAFKPHPRLLTELYNHIDWGKEKADEYYKFWASQDNTQLETGDYVDLFRSSDAMIHDSNSFSIVYLYTKNPILYTNDDMELAKKDKNAVGKSALECHYHGINEEDICSFIQDVVINGNDAMRVFRQNFFDEYLLPPNHQTVAKNAFDSILNNLK